MATRVLTLPTYGTRARLPSADMTALVKMVDTLNTVLTDVIGGVRGIVKDTDYNLSTSVNLTVPISAGRAILGSTYGSRKLIEHDSAGSLLLPASQAAVYVWLKPDGTHAYTTVNTAPVTDAELCGSAVTSGTAVTSVNNIPIGRQNLQSYFTRAMRPYDSLNSIGNMNPCYAAMVNTAWPAANRAILAAVVPARDITIDTFKWRNASASGNYDVGVYDANGTRLWAKGSTTVPAGAVQAITITPAITLQAGRRYYLALALDNNTVTVSGIVIASVDLLMEVAGNYTCFYVNSSFPLGSTINVASPSGGAPYVPWLAVQE